MARSSPGSGTDRALEARQSKGLSLLFAVSQAVGQTLALDAMLSRALDALLAEWDGLFAAAYLTGELGDPFHFLDLILVRGRVGLPSRLLETMWKATPSLRAPLDEALAGRVSYLPEFARESFEGSSSLWDQGVRSLALVPIRRQAAQSGIILLGGRAPVPSDQKTRDLLFTVGTQLGMGIENARMVERQKRHLAHLASLNRGGQALARALDRNALLEEIRLQVMEVLSPRNFSLILTAEEGEGIEVGLSFYNGLRQEKGRFTRAAGLTGYILRTRQPLLTDDYEAECRRLGIEPAQPWEVPSRSWLGVPMLSSGRALGALVIWDEEKLRAFGEEDEEVLSTIACQAAIAIENARLYELLEQSYLDTVRTLVLAMDAKDPYTLGHSERVRSYAVEVARLLGMSEEEVQRVSYAGLLHDIGKIGVREEILLKPGKLTPEEFEEVKKHSVMGERLVGNVALLKGVGAMIRSEHENFSGGGYPDGLIGEAIPLGARIIGVADAYDAMTTDRAYRICMAPEEAVSELHHCAGTQFDPRVVEALAKIVCVEKII
jgi:HD-GYP domain-containing protein (c-di-GMP phosphodiesterase class II)